MLKPLLAASALACLLAAGSQGASHPQVDASRIFHDVEVLAGDDMEGRLAGSPGGARARAYVRGRLAAAGVLPVGTKGDGLEHPFSFTTADGARRSGTNLIGVIRGTRGADRYIVVTAHYDHLGVRGGQVFNGADDNASGVAALLAIAEHFSRARPAHSLLLAALDAEEAGLHGARALVREPPVPLASMAVNVNMDMVGRDAANRLFAAGLYHFPFLKPFLRDVARPPVVLAFGHDMPGGQEDWTRDSDHYAFHEAGIPWIYFGVEDAAQHHRATDDAATIDKALLAGAAATVLAAIRELDAHLGEIAARRRR